MTGVISITTDFGHKGPFVAVMKAVIIRRCPSATIIDYTHEVPVHWPPEAGFWLERGYRYFPEDSVHIAVVDPGVGTERDILVAEVGRHRFIAPDNGLLAPLIDERDEAEVYRVDLVKLTRMIGLDPPSATFHGRDIFAPIAAELLAGHLSTQDTGKPTLDWTPSQNDPPIVTAERVSGSVITIDTFGNLITDITHETIRSMTNPIVTVGARHYAMTTTYGRVQPGSYLALINSFGVVEIARAEGSAADGLGIGRGAPVIVRPESALPAAV